VRSLQLPIMRAPVLISSLLLTIRCGSAGATCSSRTTTRSCAQNYFRRRVSSSDVPKPRLKPQQRRTSYWRSLARVSRA
jgi:hypothetical protein